MSATTSRIRNATDARSRLASLRTRRSRRLWTLMLLTSEVAVRHQYDAPWLNDVSR